MFSIRTNNHFELLHTFTSLISYLFYFLFLRNKPPTSFILLSLDLQYEKKRKNRTGIVATACSCNFRGVQMSKYEIKRVVDISKMKRFLKFMKG